MKVKIGPYKNHFGPYQLAEVLCFWAKPVPDEIGIVRKPQWVHDFGEWLAYGSVAKGGPLFSEGREETWFAKMLCATLEFFDSLRGERVIKVHLDPWDTWSADHTLGLIILPVLKQLKASNHGCFTVDDQDVPEHLKEGEDEARYNYVMDEMIWAFEHIVNDEWEAEFYSGKHEVFTIEREDGMHEWVRGENDTFKVDYEGIQKVNDRIQNGLRLFGRYYRGLWD